MSPEFNDDLGIPEVAVSAVSEKSTYDADAFFASLNTSGDVDTGIIEWGLGGMDDVAKKQAYQRFVLQNDVFAQTVSALFVGVDAGVISASIQGAVLSENPEETLKKSLTEKLGKDVANGIIGVLYQESITCAQAVKERLQV